MVGQGFQNNRSQGVPAIDVIGHNLNNTPHDTKAAFRSALFNLQDITDMLSDSTRKLIIRGKNYEDKNSTAALMAVNSETQDLTNTIQSMMDILTKMYQADQSVGKGSAA